MYGALLLFQVTCSALIVCETDAECSAAAAATFTQAISHTLGRVCTTQGLFPAVAEHIKTAAQNTCCFLSHAKACHRRHLKSKRSWLAAVCLYALILQNPHSHVLLHFAATRMPTPFTITNTNKGAGCSCCRMLQQLWCCKTGNKASTKHPS
jgi:hypothetical protein